MEKMKQFKEEDKQMSEVAERKSLNDKIQQMDKFFKISNYFKEADKEAISEKNFKIEFKKDRNEDYSILLQKETGEIKDLSSYLPEGYKFRIGEEFACNWEKQEIIFIENNTELKGFLISLFHEIGHANKKTPKLSKEEEMEFLFHLIDDVLEEEMFTLYLTGKTLIDDRSKKIPIDNLLKLSNKETTIDELLGEGKREEFIDKQLSNMTDAQVEEFLLKWFIKTNGSHRLRAQLERDAWAFSLKQLRQLQKEGYDVFAGFNNIEEIRMYILYCLLTYDFSFGKQGNELLFSNKGKIFGKLIEEHSDKKEKK